MATIPNADLTFTPREVLTADKMNKLVANDKSLLDSVNKIFSAIYPVGSIYMSVKSTNPGSLFGGTWVQWGAGRVPVGMGSNGTTNYTTVEETGGAESHSHGARGSLHADIWLDWINNQNSFVMKSSGNGGFTGNRYTRSAGNDYSLGSRGIGDSVMVEGSTANADSRQPYITCYMWKRTA